MWNRRKFLNAVVGGLIGTTGIFAFLKGYKKIYNIKDIVEYPSPILRSVSQSIDFIDDSIITLADSMISILRYKAPFEFFTKGSLHKGLAAPQVGIQKRLTVCGLYGELKILINPEILEQSGTYPNSENCLSLPSYDRKTIKRSQNVTVKYKTLENTEKNPGRKEQFCWPAATRNRSPGRGALYRLLVLCPTNKLQMMVTPAQAGVQLKKRLDSRLRGNDEWIAHLSA